jgi:allantoinase
MPTSATALRPMRQASSRTWVLPSRPAWPGCREDQATAIRQTIEAIANFTGKAPRGWESPGLTATADTIDLLAEAGIEYVADWALDDQPVAINTRSGSIVSVPYTVELNDVVISAVQ